MKDNEILIPENNRQINNYRVFKNRSYFLEEIKTDEIIEYWIYNNKNGVKMFMYGISPENSCFPTIEMLNEYIETYRELYEH